MRKLELYLHCTDALSAMEFDPSTFSAVAVSDTCSVWNILSSRKFYSAVLAAKVHLCITSMVLYECLYKPRAEVTPLKQELMNRLRKSRSSGDWPVQECDVDDLAAIARRAPKGLGSGELSCIATAYRIRTISFLTDDRQARRFSLDVLGIKAETTPMLYGYLHYHRHLGSSDHGDVVSEHEMYEARPLSKYLDEAYHEALRCRLASMSGAASESSESDNCARD